VSTGTARLSSIGWTGLGGSSVQTVGNTSASFMPRTAWDANTSPHAVALVDAGFKVALEGQQPRVRPCRRWRFRASRPAFSRTTTAAPVKDAAGQASQVIASQVEAAKLFLARFLLSPLTVAPIHVCHACSYLLDLSFPH
jgi:hypothetical protein